MTGQADSGAQGNLFGGASAWQSLELAGAEVRYCARFVDPAIANRWMNELLEHAPWEQKDITMFGRRHPLPRLTAWYGDPGKTYAYSGITNQPHPWSGAVAEIREAVEAATSASFNSVLLNLYRSGSDTVSWHADDEVELGPAPLIASVSLGTVRRFVLRRRDDKDQRLPIDLEHGSLLVMAGDTQRLCEHSLPKTSRPVGPRVNLTFRKILQ